MRNEVIGQTQSGVTIADPHSEESRASIRDKKAYLTTVSSIVAKGLSMGVSLISVPLTIGYLGFELYGLWMTISSLNLIVTFADFGMGNGLLTTIAESHGRKDKDAAMRSVAGVFYFLTAVAASIITTALFVYPWVPWSSIYNINSSVAIAEAGPATIAFVVCTALCMPLGIAQRIQVGYQEGMKANLVASLGSLFSLGLLILAIYLRARLVWMVLAISGAQVLTAFFNSLYEFVYSRPWLIPRLGNFTFKACKVIALTGIQFLLLQLISIFAFNSDLMILAHQAGPTAVAEYSTAQRLFSLILVGQGVLLSPLWPAYGEAYVQGDLAWVRQTMRRSIVKVIALAITLSVPLVVFAGPLLRFWTHKSIAIPMATLLGLAAWSVVGGYGSAISMFLNGANQIRVQVMFGLLFCLCAVAAKVYLTSLWGSAGVIWGTVIPYTICVVVPVTLHTIRLMEDRLNAGTLRNV